MLLLDNKPELQWRKIVPWVVCLIVFLLATYMRWRALHDFCFKFIDNDQLVLWDAANDMHHGIFHEPCFYGQAYNPLFEPLLAQPFLMIGIPLRIAMPLVSGLLGYFPYVLLAWGFLKKRNFIAATFTFVYLLWLPVQFHVLDSIPRGYIPATAFASVGVYLALFTEKKSRFFWFAFFGLFAAATSENSVFLTFPVGVYLLLSHYREPKFYVKTILGFLAAAPLPLFISWFYYTHPAYNLHIIEFSFDYDTFLGTLEYADQYFKYLTPVEGNKLNIIVLFIAIFIFLCATRKNFKAAFSILSGFFLFFFALSFDKAQDATGSMFYSGARMFLSVPVSLVLFCSWAEDAWKPIVVKRDITLYILVILLGIDVICCIERNSSFPSDLSGYVRRSDVIMSDKVKDARKLCDKTEALCKKYHSGLVIIDDWRIEVAYMAPALNYPFTTMIPGYERRTWIMRREDATTRPNFIYYTADPGNMEQLAAKNIKFDPIPEDPYAFLVYTNNRNVFDVLKDMKVEIRSFKEEE